MFGLKGLYNFVNEESLEGDSLIIGKFKLLTDELVDGILDIVNNTKGRTFIYFTVSQETLPLIEVRFTAFQKLKLLKKSKIVIVKPFVNDLTSAGAKKYVSYIPDIIFSVRFVRRIERTECITVCTLVSILKTCCLYLIIPQL